jgi:hypothetical protein
MSKEGMANSFLNGNYDSKDKYLYEYADRLFTADSIFDIISIEELERFYDLFTNEKAKKEWENDSAKAITLWNKPYEELKVEITKDWVKFFFRDGDNCYTCCTYRPLHLLKCDKCFIFKMKAILGQYSEKEFDDWLASDCDMPPFPISTIFTSNYADYTCKDYNE